MEFGKSFGKKLKATEDCALEFMPDNFERLD